MAPLPSSTAGLHVRYEKAGLILDALPIPWNADAVIVEANVQLSRKSPRDKHEFTLRLAADGPAHPAELIVQPDKSGPVRVFFRFGVPEQSSVAQVCWREHSLGQIDVPIVSAQVFEAGLSVQMPTFCVALRDRSLACQSFVKTQAKNVFASAILTGTGPLGAALDLDLRLQIERSSGQSVGTIPVSLTTEQRRARQALITVLLPKLRWVDAYRVSWHVGSRCLYAGTLRTISQKTFLRSLRISATRFLLHKADGAIQTVQSLPTRDGQPLLDDAFQLVPCFYVCSGTAGMAGIAPFTLRAMKGEVLTTLAIEGGVIVTDGPTPIVLGAIPAVEAVSVKHFTLTTGDTVLGNLPLVSAPRADFNAEGGFAPLDDYLWSPAAEEQLKERLGKLLDEG